MKIDANIVKKVLQKNGYEFIKTLGSGTNTSFYECTKNGQRLAVKFQCGDSKDKKAEDYLNKQKYNWFTTLSFEEASKPENKTIFSDIIKKINPDKYYKYLNLPKAVEKDITDDLKNEGVGINDDEKIYIAEAMLVDDTYGNYIFKKIRDRWEKEFKKANAGNENLLDYLEKILKEFPNSPISDIEREMKKFATKNKIVTNQKEITVDKKERLCTKTAYEMLPVLKGSIKGLSVLHSKGRAHMDLHTQNLYLKRIGEKTKVQVADFDRMVSEKEASDLYGMTLNDAMCEDIKAAFNSCVDRIIKDLYGLTPEDMPESFQSLYKKVQNGDYSNANKLLGDSYYKKAITDLKQMAKNYEEYENQKKKSDVLE